MAGQRNRGKGSRGAGGDGEIARLAAGQHGLISLEQLAEAGVNRQSASHRSGLERLHRVHRGVYAVGHRSIGEPGRHLAAVFACGPGALISHLSAAALWGLREVAPVVIDVIVPCQTGRKIDGIRARRCRYPESDEHTNLNGIPCTTPDRTLIDLAGTIGRTGLQGALDQAAVLGLLDPIAIDISLQRAGRRPGVSLLRALLGDLRDEDGSIPLLRSRLEARMLRALSESGLPRPRCNAILEIEGESFEIDMLWQEERLAIETDGEETHGTPLAFQRDRRRDQILGAAGYRTARVTWRQMGDEPAAVLERIRRMLEPDDRPER